MPKRDRGRARQLRQARARLDRIVEERACILCGDQGVAIGACTASAEVSRQLGAGAGKRRVFGYMLCGRCMRLPDPSTRTEDTIIARWHLATCGVSFN